MLTKMLGGKCYPRIKNCSVYYNLNRYQNKSSNGHIAHNLGKLLLHVFFKRTNFIRTISFPSVIDCQKERVAASSFFPY